MITQETFECGSSDGKDEDQQISVVWTYHAEEGMSCDENVLGMNVDGRKGRGRPKKMPNDMSKKAVSMEMTADTE